MLLDTRNKNIYDLWPRGPLPILLGTDVQLRFSKYPPPPFIYSIFLKTIPIYIFPLNILTQSYIS
jgi:hypothetical protein